MRISDWSSDVCSSDLKRTDAAGCARARGAAAMKAPGTGGGLTFSDLHRAVARDRSSDFLPLVAWVEEEEAYRCIDAAWCYACELTPAADMFAHVQNGRAACRERVCTYVYISAVAEPYRKKPTSTVNNA